ncbi:MFS transporter [Wenjunlia tyrosinilytica]|uniref:MFS transporter n=1 Tax=Wenjunlia tyrosinilytica TaxID=1544741 RepID=A0A918DTU4_9ACTN|nr:MFS transporter [Wenjunlia tyrosinilytica]GGO82213.1 MFS transporter [Wenjunlia tyrosinilytica]
MPSIPSPRSEADADGAEARRVRRARVAVATVFALHGCVAGSFATRIPWVQDRLDLSPGHLGLALSFPALGASLAMPRAGRLVHRCGGRAAVRGLLTLWCAGLALPALAPGLPVLCAVLLLYGASAGMADVAMNGQGVEVEQRFGRSIMSGLHGMWSLGALSGSALGVLATHTGLDARIHLSSVAAILVVAGLLACRNLLDIRPEPDEQAPPRFALPPRSALAIGGVGMCAVFAEGASMDWSGVYLRDITSASASVAAASYAAFASTMTATRLAGDTAVRRFGPVRTVRAGAVVATLGGLLVVLARVPALAIAGFALLGVGIAVVVPLAFAAAGKSGRAPSQAIAGVATITYATGLLAPAAFGAIADASSLTVSFAMVTTGTAVLIVAAGALKPAATGVRAGSPGPAPSKVPADGG